MPRFEQKFLFTIFLLLMETSCMVQAAVVQDLNGKEILDHTISNQVHDGDMKTVKNNDLLVRNTTIIDVINKRILTNKDIGVIDGKITLIEDSSPRQDIVGSANDYIDGSDYIVLPGFVNTHTHLWQHISKSYAPKESLQKWVKVYKPVHYLTEDEVFDVVLAASCEALLSGITTVSDYASLSFNEYGFERNADAILNAGLNGVLVWNNPSIFLHDEIKLREIERLRVKYQNHFDVWMGFGPLSFYSIPMVYSGILMAKQLGMATTEHTMENNEEQRAFYNNTITYLSSHVLPHLNDKAVLYNLINLTAPSNVDAYEQLLRAAEQILKFDRILQNDTFYEKLTDMEKNILDGLQQTYNRRISPLILLEYFQILKDHLAIHSVWLQNQDIDILKRNNMPISHNPESNMYLTSGIAPVDTYLKENILVTIGTDGAASNDGINFFSAMREMWNVYKINLMNTEISKNFDEWNIIQAATINGAKALKIDHKVGSIDVGKQADMIFIAKNELGVSPLRPDTTIPLLIYSANARNVKYVVSNGTVRVENSVLKYQNQARLAERLSEIAANVDVRVVNGKNWTDFYTVTDKDLDQSYWYKYRSIRKNDTVAVLVRSDSDIFVCVAVSGNTFGGGTATVVNEIVNERFPENYLPKAFSKRISLDRGSTLTVFKERGIYSYQIYINGTFIFGKNCDVPGQLLITAVRKNSQLTNICRDANV